MSANWSSWACVDSWSKKRKKEKWSKRLLAFHFFVTDTGGIGNALFAVGWDFLLLTIFTVLTFVHLSLNHLLKAAWGIATNCAKRDMWYIETLFFIQYFYLISIYSMSNHTDCFITLWTQYTHVDSSSKSCVFFQIIPDTFYQEWMFKAAFII